MQNIEINTSQNVGIIYEVANLGDRLFAFLIDLLVIGVGFLLSMLFSAIVTDDSTSWFFYMVSIPFFVFYTLVSEILMKGQTLGKRALKIQVVKLNGVDAKPSDYFLRWIFRLIDIYLSMGTIAAIFVATSKKGQRLGDLVSETSAIRIMPSSRMQFYEMMEKYNTKEYEPQFPQVKKLSEAEMLFVQRVILRYQRYKNEAHQQVLTGLCDKLKTRLNISAQEAAGLNEVKFLMTLIKDYIVITR